MTIPEFLEKLKTTPNDISFTDTMRVIEVNYTFTETAFKNGATFNEAGQNSGSCKLFAFAEVNKLNKEETLACFGDYYRKDVLEHPKGTDHANIRNFMSNSWDGIEFKGIALASK